MKTAYENVPEIVTFFNKAQNKIAQLSTLLASEAEDEDHKVLLLDLSDFIESLDSIYCYFSIPDALRYIQFWNRRANLTSIPFIQITDYIVDITGCTPDLSGIEDTVREILSRYPHNSLANIQGGSSTERYHLTKAQVDWINCQMAKTPCPDVIGSTVSLTIQPNRQPSSYGYFELGTTVTMVGLLGHINYGTDQKASSFEYKKNGQTFGSTNTNPTILQQPNAIQDSSIVANTTYSFTANFPISGTQTANQSISFAQPLYYGLIVRNNYNNTAYMQQNGTKVIRTKGNLTFTFDIPVGNTNLPSGDHLVPFIFIPESWGAFFSTIKVGVFDYRNDWSYFGGYMTLADGTQLGGVYAFYENQSEGSVTFDFNY